MACPAEKENQTPNAQPQEASQICHSTHSFGWRLGQRKPMTLTCNKAGTVEESLRKSFKFRENEKKNNRKDLVVVRSGKPIPSHFPCTLIQPGEQLVVNYVKPVGNKPVAKYRPRSSDQIVVFNIHTKGGKNVTKIIRNPALRSYPELSVYAYKGEKVKHALKRDGRFLQSIFKKTCALYDYVTNVEMDNLVDDLDGRTFQIIMINKNSPPDSQPSSLEDVLDSLVQDNDEDETLVQDNDEDEILVQENEDDNDEDNNNETFEQGNAITHNLGGELHEIPDSKKMRSHLSSQLRDFLEKKLPGQGKKQRHLLSVEYGRNHGSFTVETMTTLMTSYSKSICQVRIRGRPVASGFLLFDSFVLTNFHVIKDIINWNMCQLLETVSVHFSFKNLDHVPVAHNVKQEVVCEHGFDAEGHKCDWVLLELNTDQVLPSGLLEHFGFIPKSGSICIIGHPHGDVQSVDQTCILTTSSQKLLIEKHYNENLKYDETTGKFIQFVTPSFAESVFMALQNSRDLNYESCFYFGSSGSPVFDIHGNVVAMHSGGYTYERPSGETQSVIEYGHTLSYILENLIVKLVHRGKLDVLKKYLGCFNKHRDAINHHVKKLVASQNYIVFHDTAQSVNDLNDDILKEFFDFICGPDSMDIGN